MLPSEAPGALCSLRQCNAYKLHHHRSGQAFTFLFDDPRDVLIYTLIYIEQ